MGMDRLVLRVDPLRRLVPLRKRRIAAEEAVARSTQAEALKPSEQPAIEDRQALAVVAAAGDENNSRRQARTSQRAFEDLRHEQYS
jgi:hypothetical protein